MTELIIALVTLTVLEIVLGVDNVIFISILSGKLPKDQQARQTRRPLAAMVMRVARSFPLPIARLSRPSRFNRRSGATDPIIGGLFRSKPLTRFTSGSKQRGRA
jgi:hypothetical protein